MSNGDEKHGEVTISRLQIDSLKKALVDRIWMVVFCVASVVVPVSVARVSLVGWRSSFTTHVLMWLFMLAVVVNRKRISAQVKIGAMVCCFGAIGVFGLYDFGVLGFGVWFFVVSIIIVGVLSSLRAAVALFGLMIVIISGFMVAHMTGAIIPPVDLSLYVKSWMPWLMLLIASGVLPMVVLVCVRKYQETIMSLLYEVERQRDLVQQQANFDALTDLPTRRLALDRLTIAINRATRHHLKVAVCFADLDEFKDINDTHGHRAGDWVLVEVGRRMLNGVRGDDTVARLGGDEFLLILNDIDSREHAEMTAQRLMVEVAQPMVFQDTSLVVRASVGVAMFPDDGELIDELIHRADESMYRRKHSFRKMCPTPANNRASPS